MAASLTSRTFGFLPSGESVSAWTLTGHAGLQIEVLAYGGIVSRLLAPDRDGRVADVVLGYNDLNSYLKCEAYFGAIAGRVAGRISGGRFSIDGAEYRVAVNDPPNHLHGGVRGFNRRLWTGTPLASTGDEVSLRLARTSSCGEEGYPGTVQVTVTYTITAENIFRIATEGTTDSPTPFSLTHHSYFNLAGEGTSSVAGHNLQIFADCIVPTDPHMALLGRLEPVHAGNDFREPRALGAAIPQLYQNHGDLYQLRSVVEGEGTRSLVAAARLTEPASGRVLDVFTTNQYLQLYTGTSLDSSMLGKSGKPYKAHAGLCLECEGYPDGINVQQLGSILIEPGKPYRQVTEYAFSTCAAAETHEATHNALEPHYAPPMPNRKDFRIGILGSGFIVNECHLVSYRSAGFHPVAIASRNPRHAAAVAATHRIPAVYETFHQLLDDASIEVLDIAVPPMHQLLLIRAACTRGTVKGILAQKPLALTYAEAAEAVACCEDAGITLAVNQNMRFDPSVSLAKALLDRQMLGGPVFATIDMRGVPHWQPWQAETSSATLRIMSIHHLDCMRFWFGEPVRVFCSTRTDPRTRFPHTDGICTTILEYENGLQCVIIDDVWTGPVKEGCPGDIRIEWRIEGLDGLAIGDIGWCKDPYTTPSTLRYAVKGDTAFHHLRPTQSWFRDAFGATMGQLLVALESGKPCTLSGRDHLRTMALVEAAVLSAAEHRTVSPDAIIAAHRAAAAP